MFWNVAKRFHKRHDGNHIAPWKYVRLLVILSWPKPWAYFVSGGLAMAKVAILFDGGFFIRRLPRLTDWSILNDAVRADQEIGRLVRGHVVYINNTARVENPYALLYRCFSYDANPYDRRGHLPVSRKAIDYAKTDTASFRRSLFDLLRHRANFALRLGEVRRHREWIIKEQPQKDLLARREGTRVILDPLWQNVAPDLFEHIDQVHCPFPRPGTGNQV